MSYFKYRKLALFLIVAIVVSLGGWLLAYPSNTDPKNIKYVLWKLNLYSLDPEQAVATMVGDSQRDKIVLGKTRADLQREFKVLLPISEVSPYLRRCYEASDWNNRDVLFIGRSEWMIVFGKIRQRTSC